MSLSLFTFHSGGKRLKYERDAPYTDTIGFLFCNSFPIKKKKKKHQVTLINEKIDVLFREQ